MITLTDEQFDEIVSTVINQVITELGAPSVLVSSKGQVLIDIGVHANNTANGYDEDGKKVA